MCMRVSVEQMGCIMARNKTHAKLLHRAQPEMRSHACACVWTPDRMEYAGNVSAPIYLIKVGCWAVCTHGHLVVPPGDATSSVM